jgi:AraC family transcriptional regulator
MAAATAGLSTYHFAHLFQRATELPPYQYVVMRRAERAKLLLCDGDLFLAEVATRAGFSDQRQFSHHLMCLVGVTLSRFRLHTRIA